MLRDQICISCQPGTIFTLLLLLLLPRLLLLCSGCLNSSGVGSGLVWGQGRHLQRGRRGCRRGRPPLLLPPLLLGCGRLLPAASGLLQLRRLGRRVLLPGLPGSAAGDCSAL